ncbi:hypothetical protein RX329_22255 [Bradyrhizobium sp. BWC-3-1]|nr:hypothetical protein [Bradyrhizobium sp. BWC-3-1]WOH55051.1 hypothetical protein RX329_22255 [Bradyrhizobium sp. BWC-3-1]
MMILENLQPNSLLPPGSLTVRDVEAHAHPSLWLNIRHELADMKEDVGAPIISPDEAETLFGIVPD